MIQRKDNRMDKLMSWQFWKNALARAIYTIAETFLAMIVGAVVFTDVNWVYTLSASAFAGFVSLLKSIVVGMPEYKEE